MTSPTRRFLLALAGAALLTAGAATAEAAPLSAADQALVDKATAYIQTLGSVAGRFTQVDARGVTTGGQLWLQRPGKARFAYDGASGLLVVSNGNNVNIWDPRLKSYESYPLSRTPLALLLAREVRLDRGVTISAVTRRADGFSITAVDAKRQTLGKISLDFSDGPVALTGWTVTDVKGGQTRVTLSGLRPASGLDKKLFVLSDPRPRVGKP
ncbi:MAG: outer rane lipoprotein carrier protein LolA [Caulobacter sp.]|nr:outer rane lipoprotein carrier protein LolA [Caulobacter sp.]